MKRHCSALIVLQVLSDGSESGETQPAANVQTHCLLEGDSLDYETAGKLRKNSKTKCFSAVTLEGGHRVYHGLCDFHNVKTILSGCTQLSFNQFQSSVRFQSFDFC